jgi:Flp pilus assembly protein TadG
MVRLHTKDQEGSLRGDRGTALVELALVMPLLLLLLLGMLDFGKAFREWLEETHLANEGARLAAVNYCPDATQADCGWSTLSCPTTGSQCLAWYIANQIDTAELKSGRALSSYAPAQNAAQACISYPNGSATTVGDPVQVDVKAVYHWLNYMRIKAGLTSSPIRGRATMRLEAEPDSTSTVCWPTSGGAGT